MKVKIEVSARHLHLNLSNCLALFGTAELSKRNDLSQKGEFASNFVVEIVGPEKSLHNVRVLGPLRSKSQLEISRSDSYLLGIDAPLALSGSGRGCEIKIVGPKGTIIAPIAMVAERHVHLAPSSAQKMKLRNHDSVRIKIEGDRGLTFDNVIVRIDKNFVDTVHLDTDEANAAGVSIGSKGLLIS